MTASARQCSTCYGRDGTIASRSINKENNIEALVIFKTTQSAQGSTNRYKFLAELKKLSGSGKVNKNMYHTSSKKGKTSKFLDVSRWSHAVRVEGGMSLRHGMWPGLRNDIIMGNIIYGRIT